MTSLEQWYNLSSGPAFYCVYTVTADSTLLCKHLDRSRFCNGCVEKYRFCHFFMNIPLTSTVMLNRFFSNMVLYVTHYLFRFWLESTLRFEHTISTVCKMDPSFNALAEIPFTCPLKGFLRRESII